MDSQEFEQFKEFINKILYEKLSLDDYAFIMDKLDIPLVQNSNVDYWTYKSGCHNADCTNAKGNLCFYLESKSFYCWSECNCAYNILTLVEQRFKILDKPMSRFKCMKWICEQLNIPFDFKSDNIEKPKNVYNWKASLSKYLTNGNKENELTFYDSKVLDYFPKIYHQSWLNDNISIEVMERYNIRYYPFRDQIVIPCYNIDGKLIGIRSRNLNPNCECKYIPLSTLDNTEYKFPVNNSLYGINYTKEGMRYRKKCLICESEKAVLQCETYFQRDNFAVGLYGKGMSKEKRNIILEQGINEIIIMLDFDYTEVGDNKEFNKFKDKVYKIGNYFKGFCKVTALITYEPHEYKCNALDMGKEKFIELYENREELY